jgi:tetratricopeptide (TPR) repeat protein
LEERFPETAENQPELLAHHYTEAGMNEQAVRYWHQAGHRAVERSAHVEAISHLRQGLELFQTLPETPERLQHAVEMLIALGTSLRFTKGQAAPEVGQTYTYARQLCQPHEDPQRLSKVLYGLWNYYEVRAEFQTALTLGEQLLTLAHQAQDSAMLPSAHRALGTTLFWLGAATSAHTHYVQGIALYDAQQHYSSVFLHGQDYGVTCRIYAAWTLWVLGYPDQGLTRSQEALALAQQVAHPFSLQIALSVAAMFYQSRREVQAVHEHAEAATRLATDQGFPVWRAQGAMGVALILTFPQTAKRPSE